MTKRSEAAKKLAHLLFLGSLDETESEIFEALGELGIEWPKEEPELPEKVEYRVGGDGEGGYIRVPGLQCGSIAVEPLSPPTGGRPYEAAVKRELARRYNVVGEVVKELEGNYPSSIKGAGALSCSGAVRYMYLKLKGIVP